MTGNIANEDPVVVPNVQDIVVPAHDLRETYWRQHRTREAGLGNKRGLDAWAIPSRPKATTMHRPIRRSLATSCSW